MSTVPGAEEPVLLLERRGNPPATLNRPRKGNSFSNELIAALGQLVANLRRSAAEAAGARAVVLTGSGTKAFSAGADIHNLVGLTKTARPIRCAGDR